MSLDGRPGASRSGGRYLAAHSLGARTPRRAPRGARLRRASLVFLALAAAALTCACGQKSLTKVSSEAESIEIVSVLRQSGIAAEKQESGEASARQWEVFVGESDYDLANRLLLYYELPRREEKPPEANIFSYEAERQAQQLKESKRQIEEHLRGLNGVARVSVVISPAQDEARLNPSPAKATVNITHKEAAPPFTAEEVQQAVANSYPTLKPENVFVKLQFEPPPAAPKRAPPLDPRVSAAFAAGIALVVALTALLFFLLRRRRRPRAGAEPAAVEESSPAAPDESGPEPPMLTPTTRSNAG